MQNNINSSDLYIRLLEEIEPIKELTKNTQQFHSFLTFCNLNDTCNQVMLSISKAVPRNEFLEKIPDLPDECKQCWKFFLNPRNKSKKKYDIVLGRKYEEVFISFLKKLDIHSDKADKSNKVLPDNLIIDKSKNVCAYYEVKYHNAPFVMAYKFNKGRECYEGSITLDYEKVAKQIKLTRELTDLPVFYVHWVDFPCVKGIFYMSLEDTKNCLDKGIEFKRQEREGDFATNTKGTRKVGYTNKFYPSLIGMKSLSELITCFGKFI